MTEQLKPCRSPSCECDIGKCTQPGFFDCRSLNAGAVIHAGDGGYSEGTQEDYDAFVKIRNQSLAKMIIK